ncbi:MAG: metal-dependent transcriptional regulator [Vicingaceae bacterium]
MSTQSEENYLKVIYQLASKDVGYINTSDLASKLDLKPSSVTDMIQKLDQKRLVQYKKYQGVKLSAKGEKLALGIIRKHRLWEVFLHETLGFTWDKVHDIAEQLEHINSTELIERLDLFLNHPKTDPHGDPIPDKVGRLNQLNRIRLSQLRGGEKGVLSGANDSSSEFLRYLKKRDLTLGTIIKITHFNEFDQSYDLEIGTENKTLTISNQVASNLFISESKP